MDRGFGIEKRENGNIVILDIQGDILISGGAQLLRDTVATLISDEKTRVVVNMKDVEFVDSSGVGALVRSYTSLTNAGGQIRLVCLQDMIRKTLQVTGLLAVFRECKTEGDAISSLSW